MILKPEDLKPCTTFWQRQLYLQDWEVETCLKPHCHFDNGTDGHNEASFKLKLSTICLCDPAQHNAPEAYDMEQVLVHELLHLHFEPLYPKDRSSRDCDLAEQAIDQLSRALVNLNRSVRR